MTSFSIILALGPIAVYSIVLGMLHARKHPKVVSGSRDLACLGLAMIGLYIVGPAQLFFPQAAFNVFGVSVWIVLVILYLFSLLFAILNTNPRLVVFGMDVDALTEHADRSLLQLDPGTRWLGLSFIAPNLGIQGIVESAGHGRISHITATKREQNVGGWIAFERALSTNLKSVEFASDTTDHRWFALGFALLGLIGYALFSHPTSIAQGLRDVLRY
ncbi:MAG: hypothetical protein SGI77_12210 [Pirellulaceae bacterium]|nr:hypothetical protein [Pirellulaceae bacterium]